MKEFEVLFRNLFGSSPKGVKSFYNCEDCDGFYVFYADDSCLYFNGRGEITNNEGVDIGRYTIGTTKLVFFSNDGEFVYKIPFVGSITEVYSELYKENYSYFFYDEDEYDMTEEEFTEKVLCAKFVEDNTLGSIIYDKDQTLYELQYSYADCCDYEMQIYEDFIETVGIEGVFLANEVIYSDKNFKIYSQSKVSAIGYGGKVSVKSYSSAHSINKGEDMPVKLLAEIVEYYGESMAKQIVDFCENRINDLHDENFGMYEERPVIFDYAGVKLT